MLYIKEKTSFELMMEDPATCPSCRVLGRFTLLRKTRITYEMFIKTTTSRVRLLHCKHCGAFFDVTAVTNQVTAPADFELLLERSAGREFPVMIIILFAFWVAALITPFLSLLIALCLWSYRTYFGPRAWRWFRVLCWISAL